MNIFTINLFLVLPEVLFLEKLTQQIQTDLRKFMAPESYRVRARHLAARYAENFGLRKFWS